MFSVRAHRRNQSQSVGLSNVFTLLPAVIWQLKDSLGPLHISIWSFSPIFKGSNPSNPESWDTVCVWLLLCLLWTDRWANGSRSVRSFCRLHLSQWCLLFIRHLTLKAQWSAVCLPALLFQFITFTTLLKMLDSYCSFRSRPTRWCVSWCESCKFLQQESSFSPKIKVKINVTVWKTYSAAWLIATVPEAGFLWRIW